MFDLRILIYIEHRCSWYVWTIPPLSGVTEGLWITPQGCQPKRRQEGLWAVDTTSQTVCSQGRNPDRERVGVHQQSAYFIHRVAINILFSVAQLQHLSDLCVRAIILSWVAVKMFWFKKTRGWLVGWSRSGHCNYCSHLVLDLKASLQNAYMDKHKCWLPLWQDLQHWWKLLQR